MGIIGMSTADIICEFCNENISEYYHEGYGGFKKKTYRKKQWLINVADRVQARSTMYQKQYWGCAKELKKKRFFFF